MNNWRDNIPPRITPFSGSMPYRARNQAKPVSRNPIPAIAIGRDRISKTDAETQRIVIKGRSTQRATKTRYKRKKFSAWKSK
jgi:hypothetical protein